MNSTLIYATVVLLLLSIVSCVKDYYQILEIHKSATDKEIRKAFRNLAIKYHPDKDPDADPSIFMEIKEGNILISIYDYKIILLYNC